MARVSDTTEPNDYILGNSERELRRLEAQARLYSDATRDALVSAGIKPGMKILDLGTGAGDVALIAAAIVGSSGAVTGIDISAEAVSLATRRAAQTGVEVTFEISPILAYDRYPDFDAVISRFLLVHLPKPGAAIREIAGRMRAGAILVSMEMDMSTASATVALPLFEQHLGYIVQLYIALGLSPDMGLRLHETYRAGGLSPTLAGYTRVGDRDDPAGFDFFSESIRSLLPALEKLGIARAAEIDIDTLSSRLVAEANPKDPAIFYPRLVAAWARSQ